MNACLSLDDYQKRFEGFGIRDCAVVSPGCYLFVAVQDWDDARPRPFESELSSRLHKLEIDSERPWVTAGLTGFSRLKCAGLKGSGDVGLAMDGLGQVYVRRAHGGGMENNVPGGQGVGPLRGAVNSIKQLNDRLYGCGGARSLFRRVGPDRWEEIGPLPPEGQGEVGFHDFDGFSESDLYAAGGQGDVWRYDGRAWHQVAFPSNQWIKSVCCGADGQVYVGAESGTVFRGRGDQWELIHQGDLSLPFRDMVWFNDRVYATNDYGLWEIRDGQVRPSAAPIEITNCAGNLSVANGVMLMAGAYGAAVHDGQSWSRLFSISELARASKGR
ncbi:WD40/YVTN/BNR-like repeat-containing protein [Roseateles amylovorans]|uniref:Uncharacterized protein n=1 Tax=Roseateles amylovorans TaxID=2978473 RepID=A0ABY6B6S4_9BURK|nr:hypothetical protein [Roseateles amylovorans]UXH80629.1 hypothetical protein N4261_12435 [Roseateles amylovorans]